MQWKNFMIILSGLTIAATANADSLFTPTLWVAAPNKFACNLTNISDKTIQVRTQIISNGSVLFDSGKMSLTARHTANHTIDGLTDGGPIYCSFFIQGDKGRVRGAGKAFRAPPENGTDIAIVPAN